MDAEPVLHCPNCSYNLTGLPENRCPECGEAFSPEELKRSAVPGSVPISTREVLLHLFGLPVAMWTGLGIWLVAGAWAEFLVVVFLLAIILHLVNGLTFARRLFDRLTFKVGPMSGILEPLLVLCLLAVIVAWTFVMSFAVPAAILSKL